MCSDMLLLVTLSLSSIEQKLCSQLHKCGRMEVERAGLVYHIDCFLKLPREAAPFGVVLLWRPQQSPRSMAVSPCDR